MMKKMLILLSVLLILCGCTPKKKPSEPVHGCDLIDDCGDDYHDTEHLDFKQAYESLNGKTNSSGKEHRSVTIAPDNPFVEVSAEEIVKKMDDKKTFYVYIGDEMCPWCRSVIEKAIEIAKEAKVEMIYYVQIWDDEHNEILRDQYRYEDGELLQVLEGTEAYRELLKRWEDLLADYMLTVDEEEIEVGEKRIYAPNFLYIENGEAVRFTTGISDLQEDARAELDAAILQEEETQFKAFFGVN